MMRAILDEAERAGIVRLFAEVSITARPFFERHGFGVLAEQQVVVRGGTGSAEQQVVVRGVPLANFRMERIRG